MKIVLREDVPKVGEAGSIQNVSDGYARNYLIPKGLAVVATDGEIKTAEHNMKVRERKVARQEEQLQTIADKIQGTRLEFEANAGEQGRLFGSVTANDIITRLNEQIGEEVDRRKLQLTDPIRTIGEHEIEIHLVGKLRPTITVVVAPEGGFPQEEEAETGEAEVPEELQASDEDLAMDEEATAEVAADENEDTERAEA